MDLFKTLKETQLEGEAISAKYEARQAEQQVAALRRQHEELVLVVQALWSMHKEQSGLDDDELKRRVADQRQAARSPGKAAGAMCPDCHHQLPANAPSCIYCGRPRT